MEGYKVKCIAEDVSAQNDYDLSCTPQSVGLAAVMVKHDIECAVENLRHNLVHLNPIVGLSALDGTQLYLTKACAMLNNIADICFCTSWDFEKKCALQEAADCKDAEDADAATKTATTLVLPPLEVLYSALAQVESDRGATSANVYQLRNIYIDDVNRIQGIRERNGQGQNLRRFVYADALDRRASEDMMRIYWEFWGTQYLRKTGQQPTYAVLARMHNGGGADGWCKYATKSYWRRVKAQLERLGVQP